MLRNQRVTRFLVWVALSFLLPGAAAAANVAIVVSKDMSISRKAVSALQAALPTAASQAYVFPSAEKSAIEAVLEQVGESKPKVIVAVGPQAAKESAQAFPRTPIVYLLVIYPERVGLTERDNVYGVSWSPSPKVLAHTISAIVPRAKVGMISSMQTKTQTTLLEAFRGAGLMPVVSRIKDDQGVPQALRDLHGKMDVLWMSLDPALANASAFEILRTYAIQNKIPLLVPFELPENSKALGGIAVAPETAGALAARLVRDLLNGKAPDDELMFVEGVQLSLDLNTAQAIGIKIPSVVLETAAKVYAK